MVEKTAIGHSKTINEDTEFTVTRQQSSAMVQLLEMPAVLARERL